MRRRVLAVVVAGAALGVASRLEETHGAGRQWISTRPTWVVAALLLGAIAGARRRRDGAWAGAAALTAANAAWYAWISVAEPGVDLLTVAGSPLRWLVLGLAIGGLAGGAGAACAGAAGRRRGARA